MLDLFTPAQWGTLFANIAMVVVVIGGLAMLGEVYIERRREREKFTVNE
jgi:hypothetical protein